MKAYFFDLKTGLLTQDPFPLIEGLEPCEVLEVGEPIGRYADLPKGEKAFLYNQYTIMLKSELDKKYTHLILDNGKELSCPIAISSIDGVYVNWDAMGDPKWFKK